MNKLLKLVGTTSARPQLYLLLLALIVLNIMMNFPGLPTSAASMRAIAPGFTPFDLQYRGYTPESFTADLSILGENGRRIYRNFMLCDIFFPAVYGLFFSSLVFLVFRNRQSWMKWLFLVPLLTAFMDYVENILLAVSFSAYPSPSAAAISMASFATQAKMVFNFLLVIVLMVSLAAWLATFFKRR